MLRASGVHAHEWRPATIYVMFIIKMHNVKKVVYMIVVSSGLTKLFNSVGHFGVIGVCEPDRRSAGIRLLCKNKNSVMTWKRAGCPA